MFASWIRPVASVVEELAYFKTCMMCFVGVLAVRCLAKRHVGNAHCVKSFENVVPVLSNAC